VSISDQLHNAANLVQHNTTNEHMIQAHSSPGMLLPNCPDIGGMFVHYRFDMAVKNPPDLTMSNGDPH